MTSRTFTMEDHRLGPTQHRLEQGYTIGDVDDDIRGRSQLSTFMYSYRAYGGGRGHDASVLFLNVDILLMLPSGGYD